MKKNLLVLGALVFTLPAFSNSEKIGSTEISYQPYCSSTAYVTKMVSGFDCDGNYVEITVSASCTAEGSSCDNAQAAATICADLKATHIIHTIDMPSCD